MTPGSNMGEANIRKLGDLLLVNVPRELHDSEVLHLRRQALNAVKLYRSRWVLLDFAEVEVCDSFFGRFIHTMTETVRMMGARVVVSSLQDAVIETLVEMGFTLPGVHAVLDLDDALTLSREARDDAADEEGELDAWLASSSEYDADDVDVALLDELAESMDSSEGHR